MKMRYYLTAVVAVSLVGILSLSDTKPNLAQAAAPASAKGQAEPVEEDMHEFMEYVFQPTYKRLKQTMAAEPADSAAWKGIKSDGLILAEGGNLLLLRGPAENAEAWAKHSTAVRQEGAKLYQAGKKKDFAAASASYRAMLTNCNACHTEFADGEHQLAP
ncbi:MAG: hypothetical protein WD045_03430 [Pirellulaceae bacterium]